jgi:hypothetical protein
MQEAMFMHAEVASKEEIEARLKALKSDKTHVDTVWL